MVPVVCIVENKILEMKLRMMDGIVLTRVNWLLMKLYTQGNGLICDVRLSGVQNLASLRCNYTNRYIHCIHMKDVLLVLDECNCDLLSAI